MKNKSLFEKLAAKEKKFFETDFFSPVLRGCPVRVSIEGIIVTFNITPKDYEGWGVFKTADKTTARLKREPTIQEKNQYLECFPKLSFVICRQGERVSGVCANQNTKMKIQGQVPILLPEATRLFETVDVRWDGENFWYDKPSSFRSPRIATELRELLANDTEPEDVKITGMTFEEKLAYQIAFIYEIENKKDKEEERIKAALEKAGGIYKSYLKRNDSYTVEFEVDGNLHKSTIDKNNLSVVAAGICLTDHMTGVSCEKEFDLQSLVSVIREGYDRHLIHRVGI